MSTMPYMAQAIRSRACVINISRNRLRELLSILSAEERYVFIREIRYVSFLKISSINTRTMNIGISHPDINETHSNSSREAEEQEEVGDTSFQDNISRAKYEELQEKLQEKEKECFYLQKKCRTLTEENRELKKDKQLTVTGVSSDLEPAEFHQVEIEENPEKMVIMLSLRCDDIEETIVKLKKRCKELEEERDELKMKKDELKKTIDNEDGARDAKEKGHIVEPEPSTKTDGSGSPVLNRCFHGCHFMEKYEKSEKEKGDIVVSGKKMYQSLQCQKKENEELCKENEELRDQLERVLGENVKDKLEKLSVNNDEENVEGQHNPDEMPPSVSKKLGRKYSWRDPFNCPASCVMSVAFFIMGMITEKPLCLMKFFKEVQRRLDEECGQLSKEFENENKDEDTNFGNCSSSLDHLMILDLIDDEPFFSSDPIRNVGELDEAIKKAIGLMREKKILIALFLVDYPKESNVGRHCMMISPFKDESDPVVCAEVYDVQTGKLWPQCDKHFKSVNQFEIYDVKKIIAEKFTEKCGVLRCKEERQAATSSGKATGVAYDCLCDDEDEMLDLDFYNEATE